MIAQFKQDFYNKNFSLQDKGKGDKINTLQNRIKFWLNVIDMGGPLPNNLFGYDFNDDGLDHCVHGAKLFPETRELKNLFDIFRYI